MDTRAKNEAVVRGELYRGPDNIFEIDLTSMDPPSVTRMADKLQLTGIEGFSNLVDAPVEIDKTTKRPSGPFTEFIIEYFTITSTAGKKDLEDKENIRELRADITSFYNILYKNIQEIGEQKGYAKANEAIQQTAAFLNSFLDNYKQLYSEITSHTLDAKSLGQYNKDIVKNLSTEVQQYKLTLAGSILRDGWDNHLAINDLKPADFQNVKDHIALIDSFIDIINQYKVKGGSKVPIMQLLLNGLKAACEESEMSLNEKNITLLKTLQTAHNMSEQSSSSLKFMGGKSHMKPLLDEVMKSDIVNKLQTKYQQHLLRPS